MKKRKALDARKKVPECVINHTNDKLIIQMDDKDKYSQIPVSYFFLKYNKDDLFINNMTECSKVTLILEWFINHNTEVTRLE
jgi:hypothetical protein